MYGLYVDDPDNELRRDEARYRGFAESFTPIPPAWTVRRKFYEDVEANGELLADIRPDPLRSAGPRVKIYKVQ